MPPVIVSVLGNLSGGIISLPYEENIFIFCTLHFLFQVL